MKCTRNLHSYFAERLYYAMKVCPVFCFLTVTLHSTKCKVKELKATTILHTGEFSYPNLLWIRKVLVLRGEIESGKGTLPLRR